MVGSSGPRCWLLVGVDETSKARGPDDARKGDKAVVYLREAEAFAGTFEVQDDHSLTVETGGSEPAGPLAPFLDCTKPWPADEWRRAFAPGVHSMSITDYEKIRLQCEARAKGRPRPPGAPPTEGERPPKIPAKLRKPKGT